MIIAGMDTASNRCHIVAKQVCVGEQPELVQLTTITDGFAELKSPNPDIRRIKLYEATQEAIRGLCGYGDDVHVFCEEPISLRNGKTNRLLALAAGAIWAAHLDFDVYWHWVNISTWKQKIVGKGSASKEAVQVWSINNGGKAEWDEDTHDAHAICDYGTLAMAGIDSN